MNGKFMSKPTKQQLAEIKALQALPDNQIDYSDSPASKLENWRDATVGKFYRPIKQQMTLRIDAGVVAWFRAQGRGYQTQINQLLRDAMKIDLGHR